MGKIVAIGGGDVGKPGNAFGTLSIDKEIVKLSGKKHPKLLFIPTASFDSEGYVSTIKKIFGTKLGCKISTLILSNNPSLKEINHKILKTDIVYVGGGNTGHMLKMWRKSKVDKALLKAYKKGVVLSGLSAGAMCWFKYGSSDSKRVAGDKNAEYVRLKGLGLINATCSPHHTTELDRMKGLKKLIAKHGGIGLAMDDCSALVVEDNKFRIISSNTKAVISKVFKKKGKIITEKLDPKLPNLI